MKKLFLLTFLCSVVFFFACDDDDTEIRMDPIVFYDNNGYLLQATCVGDDIEFFLDATSDTTDASTGTFPDQDLYRLYVDNNNNERIDANVDLLISPLSDGRICQVFFLTENSTTGCDFPESISGETLFSGTENAEQPHINHRLRVPKTVLSSGSSIRVVVQLYDSETGWITLPQGSSIFDRATELSW